MSWYSQYKYKEKEKPDQRQEQRQNINSELNDLNNQKHHTIQHSKNLNDQNKKFKTMKIQKVTFDLKEKNEEKDEGNGPKESQNEILKYQPKKQKLIQKIDTSQQEISQQNNREVIYVKKNQNFNKQQFMNNSKYKNNLKIEKKQEENDKKQNQQRQESKHSRKRSKIQSNIQINQQTFSKKLDLQKTDIQKTQSAYFENKTIKITHVNEKDLQDLQNKSKDELIQIIKYFEQQNKELKNENQLWKDYIINLTGNNDLEWHKKEANIKRDIFQNKMHITFMFASPLACFKKSLEEISFNEEWELLKQSLRKARVKINIQKQCATFSNLQTVLNEGTLCLHFSGHGEKESNINDFRIQKDQGDFLCLENEKHKGSTYLLSSN